MSWIGRWLGRWLGGWLGSITRVTGETSNASAVAAIYYLLANNDALTAIVAEDSITAGVIPLGTSLPCIGIQEISVIEHNTVSLVQNKKFATARIQVTVLAATYPQKNTILELARKALPNSRGTINGVDVDSILPDIDGPDFQNVAATIFMQGKDFLVRFKRA